ncbi:MAG: WD40/YVTN/BNR-like repeat-containing protein, partial [Gemmatimonadota bacterium]
TTVHTLDVSPVREGVIWAGTDDGNVHVTRDGGESWTAVHGNMPDKPRHAWVSHIQASDHDAGTAYAAVHDYMRGDWTTWVYRTTNFGQDWTRLPTGNVDGFARTVEEDPENPNLLWLGTEFGLYYSLDRGRSWTEWSHGFPSGTPVRGLATQNQAHENDLVVGTYGRGAYVIDDITPLRAMAEDPDVLHADLHMFEPGPAINHVMAAPKVYRFTGSAMFVGDNEPFGATVTIAAHVPDSLARAGGPGEGGGAAEDSVEYPYTQVESEPDTTPPVPTKEAVFQVLAGDSVIQEDSLTLEEGLNRHSWDFDTEGPGREPRSMEELRKALESPEEEEPDPGFGPTALQGSYTVRVVSHGDTATGSLEVEGDPRIDSQASALQARHDWALETARVQAAATSAVEALRKARIRVSRALEVLSDQEGLTGADADSLRQAGKTVIDSLKAVEEHWTGPLDPPQGIYEAETVTGKIGITPFRLGDAAWYGPNQEERQRLQIARGAVSEAVGRTNRVLREQVADFRDRVLEAGVELIPPVETVEAPPAGGM